MFEFVNEEDPKSKPLLVLLKLGDDLRKTNITTVKRNGYGVERGWHGSLHVALWMRLYGG